MKSESLLKVANLYKSNHNRNDVNIGNDNKNNHNENKNSKDRNVKVLVKEPYKDGKNIYVGHSINLYNRISIVSHSKMMDKKICMDIYIFSPLVVNNI